MAKKSDRTHHSFSDPTLKRPSKDPIRSLREHKIGEHKSKVFQRSSRGIQDSREYVPQFFPFSFYDGSPKAILLSCTAQPQLVSPIYTYLLSKSRPYFSHMNFGKKTHTSSPPHLKVVYILNCGLSDFLDFFHNFVAFLVLNASLMHLTTNISKM